MKLVIRELANEDVDDCTDYIQRNSVAAALRFPVNVLETARWLASHPGAGHPVKVHRRSRLRSFAVRGFPNHLLFYRIEGDELVVIRVVHGARNLRRQLRPDVVEALEKRAKAKSD